MRARHIPRDCGERTAAPWCWGKGEGLKGCAARTGKAAWLRPGNSSVEPIKRSTLAADFLANYPALTQTYMEAVQSSESVGVTFDLLDYSPQTDQASSRSRAGFGIRQSGSGFCTRGKTPASGNGSGSGGLSSSGGGRHCGGFSRHNSHPAIISGTPKVSAQLQIT